MFVIDASMTLAWCLDDEATVVSESVLQRLLVEGALAPPHWGFEVANGLRSAERRGRINRSKVLAAETLLGELMVDMVAPDIESTVRVLELARRTDLTAYDAAYLDLAKTRGFGLATLDQALSGACRKERVRVIND